MAEYGSSVDLLDSSVDPLGYGIHDDEFEIVKQLKKCCDEKGKETDLERSSELLSQLGKVYQGRSPDKLCLIQSAALYNAALHRSKRNKKLIESAIEELHAHVLMLADGNEICKLTDISLSARELIKEMREKATNSLQNLPTEPNDAHFESEKIRFMQNLQDDISCNYLRMMQHVSQHCLKYIGQPPCKFSLVGIGSLARQEVTPFSDFECVIVLENSIKESPSRRDKAIEYFRWYSVIFQLVVLNFGETIVPSVAIPTLNDFEEPGGDWFFDTVTPRGISFDGFMPHACKSPLGRQRKTKNKPWKVELIQPVSDMVEYLTIDSNLRNGYHLAEILTLICEVDGDKNVYDDFAKQVHAHVHNVSVEESQLLIKQLNEDLESFSVFKNLPSVLASEKVNVKRVIYRSTTIFISTLGRLHGITNNSSFDIIDEMETRNIISSQAAHNLKFAVAIACEVRLRVYMANEGQDEWLQTRNEPNANTTEGELNIIKFLGTSVMLKYFKVAFCLQRAVSGPIRSSYDGDMLDVGTDVDIAICFYFQQYSKVIELCSNLRSEYETKSDNQRERIIACTLAIAESYLRMEKYESALAESKLAYEYTTKGQSSDFDKINCLKALGKCLFQMGCYDEALDIYTQASDLSMPLSMEWAIVNENTGNCLYKLTHYEKAIQHYQKTLEAYKTVHLEPSIKKAKCFSDIAGCLLKLNRYREAVKFYHQAKYFYGILNKQSEKAKSCNRIAYCQFKMNMLKEATDGYLEELNLLMEMTNKSSIRFFDVYTNIAGCYFSQQMFTESLTYYKLAYDLGLSTSGSSRISLLNNIGNCYLRLDNFAEALNVFRLSFEEWHSCDSNFKTDSHLLEIKDNLVMCLYKLGKIEEATAFITTYRK